MKISMRFPAFKQPPTSLNSLLEASSQHTIIQWVKTEQAWETKVKPPSRSPFHHASPNGIDAITKSQICSSRRLIYFIQCTTHTPKNMCMDFFFFFLKGFTLPTECIHMMQATKLKEPPCPKGGNSHTATSFLSSSFSSAREFYRVSSKNKPE